MHHHSSRPVQSHWVSSEVVKICLLFSKKNTSRTTPFSLPNHPSRQAVSVPRSPIQTRSSSSLPPCRPSMAVDAWWHRWWWWVTRCWRRMSPCCSTSSNREMLMRSDEEKFAGWRKREIGSEKDAYRLMWCEWWSMGWYGSKIDFGLIEEDSLQRKVSPKRVQGIRVRESWSSFGISKSKYVYTWVFDPDRPRGTWGRYLIADFLFFSVSEYS